MSLMPMGYYPQYRSSEWRRTICAIPYGACFSEFNTIRNTTGAALHFPHPSVILTISLQNTQIRIRENIIFLPLDIIVLFFVKIFILNMYGTRSSVNIDEQRIKFDDGSYTGDIMRHVSWCIVYNNSNDLTRCCLVIKHFFGFSPFMVLMMSLNAIKYLDGMSILELNYLYRTW